MSVRLDLGAALDDAAHDDPPVVAIPCQLTNVAPTITISAPKIVLVTKAYQDRPHRIPVRLGTTSGFTGTGALSMDIHNPGKKPVVVGLRIDNPGGYPGRKGVQEGCTIEPGQRTTVATQFKPQLPGSWGLFGMNGYPDAFGSYAAGEQALDPANVSQLTIFVPTPKDDHVFEIARIRTTGDVPPLPDPGRFFPFIDEFGQYIHRDWPGKLHSATEWTDRIAAEENDLAAHPGPRDRDKWATSSPPPV